MNKSALTYLAAAAFAATALIPLSSARAQDPLCKQIANVMLQQMTKPFHSYMTEVAGFNQNKPQQSEMISTSNAIYLLVNGKWRKSPQTPQQMAGMMRENAMDMKYHSCRKVGNEVVAGTPAVHYHVDVKDPDSPSTTEVWIANDRPVRTETSMDVGGGAAGHSKMTTRIEYTNVSAPAGVR